MCEELKSLEEFLAPDKIELHSRYGKPNPSQHHGLISLPHGSVIARLAQATSSSRGEVRNLFHRALDVADNPVRFGKLIQRARRRQQQQQRHNSSKSDLPTSRSQVWQQHLGDTMEVFGSPQKPQRGASKAAHRPLQGKGAGQRYGVPLFGTSPARTTARASGNAVGTGSPSQGHNGSDAAGDHSRLTPEDLLPHDEQPPKTRGGGGWSSDEDMEERQVLPKDDSGNSGRKGIVIMCIGVEWRKRLMIWWRSFMKQKDILA